MRSVGRRAWACVAATLLASIGALVHADPGAAHATAPTVALDYRLDLSDATAALPGVRIAVIDGDRALRLQVDPSTALVVRGLLDEPAIRFSSNGVWVNGRSPTATANKLVKPGPGWTRVSEKHTYTWHDHRLAPPPGIASGSSASWAIPITLDGRETAIAGTFTRVPNPSLWPWIAVGLVAAVLTVGFTRAKPGSRGGASVLLTTIAAFGALAGSCAIATGEGLAGPGAWMIVAAAVAFTVAAPCLTLISSRAARSWTAAVLACLVLMITVPYGAVFVHGVVISSIPVAFVRLALAIAFLGAFAAIPLGLLAGAEELDGHELSLPQGGRAGRPGSR